MDIEQRARDALNAAYGYLCYVATRREDDDDIEAMCREIEAHDATKAELADFKREVSEAAKRLLAIVRLERPWLQSDADQFACFIQPDPVKIDPLAEALNEAADNSGLADEDFARALRAALAKRGLTITEGDAK